MAERADIEKFIGATFRSVWALELLCMLRNHDGGRMSQDEMVAGLRGSNMIVAQSVGMLSAAGLVIVDEQGVVTYRPSDKKLDAIVGEAEQLYVKSPDAVRRIIASSWNPGIAAFADAFKLRKDDE
jgi:hypothetical protein